jgi:hypothetical protein
MNETQYSNTDVGTERGFGFVFVVVFLIAALWPLKDDLPIRLWSIGVAGIFLIAALLFPKVLGPLNILWHKFGMVLGTIMSPIIMAAIYSLAVIPTGLLIKVSGKDLLRIKKVKNKGTYWIKREIPPQPMKNQF